MSCTVGCCGVFCWVSLERQGFPASQYCSPRGNAIGVVLPGLHALLFMSQAWQRGATQTSSLELYKEQGESLQSKATDTLGFPEASSQCQQRNHRWTCCITALLVGWLMDPLWQSIPSAQQWAGRAGGRAGVRKLSQAESALEFICKSSEQVPGCKLRPRGISLKACVIVLIILLLVKCALEAVPLQMRASKWFIMLCTLLFIAEYILLGNPFLDYIQTQKHIYDFFSWLY